MFHPGTKGALVDVLANVPIDDLTRLGSDVEFRNWFELQLDGVAETIRDHNWPRASGRKNPPGYKWGHATKVLALYLRDVVLYSRYFTEAEVDEVSPWLCCPIDGIVLRGDE